MSSYDKRVSDENPRKAAVGPVALPAGTLSLVAIDTTSPYHASALRHDSEVPALQWGLALSAEAWQLATKETSYTESTYTRCI